MIHSSWKSDSSKLLEVLLVHIIKSSWSPKWDWISCTSHSSSTVWSEDPNMCCWTPSLSMITWSGRPLRFCWGSNGLVSRWNSQGLKSNHTWLEQNHIHHTSFITISAELISWGFPTIWCFQKSATLHSIENWASSIFIRTVTARLDKTFLISLQPQQRENQLTSWMFFTEHEHVLMLFISAQVMYFRGIRSHHIEAMRRPTNWDWKVQSSRLHFLVDMYCTLSK